MFINNNFYNDFMRSKSVFKKCLFILAVCLLYPFLSFSQASKFHYLPPLAVSVGGNADDMSEQRIYISTPSDTPVNFKIWPLPLDYSTVHSGTVDKLSPTEALSSGNDYYVADSSGLGQLFIGSSGAGSVINDKGYFIEADGPIYANIRYKAGSQAGGLVSKGAAALGKSFRAGSFTNGRPDDSHYLSFTSVMAVEVGTTTVTFSDINNNALDGYVDIEGVNEVYNGSGAINDIIISLNQFESYVIAIKAPSWNNLESPLSGIQGSPYPATNKDALIGMLVESNKNIAVITGGANGSMSETKNGRDHGIDQIVGLDKIGNEFIFIKGNPNDGDDYDNAIIVAHEDNTQVFLNGSGTATKTLNAGQYFSIEGDQFDGTNKNIYVKTSKNSYAYQGISNGSSANTELFFVPPLSCTSIENVETIPKIRDVSGSTWSDTGVIIIAPATASITFSDQYNPTPIWTGVATAVTINGISAGTPPNVSSVKSGGRPVTGNASYTTYIITGFTENVSIFSTYPDGTQAELYAAYYNTNGTATAGAFYSGFPNPPETTFNTSSVSGLQDCIPNVSLTLTNDSDFSSIEWEYWDGSGAVNYSTIVGWTTKTVTPTNVGFYKAIGVLTCAGYRLESNPKKISNCPKDSDNDGIFDNIDVDIDNDGIYNTAESTGVASFDISNPNNPMIVLSDASTNTSIPSAFFSASGGGVTLTGQTSGAFESTLTSGNKSGSYVVSFTQPVNLSLDEDISNNHTFRTGEKYSISILPVSLTITLLDPGDELKVDTNQNGIYDSGTVTVTSNEILFIFDSSTDNTKKFSFQSDGATQFNFKHIVEGSSANSVFNGILSLKYLDLDTDSDTVYNVYDYDSDGDLCFDSREAGFADGDLNGLIGSNPITVESMLASEPGKVNNQGEGYSSPNDLNSNGVKDFKESTVSPTFSIEPVNIRICPGDNASFTSSSTQSDTDFLWQKYNVGSSLWENLSNNSIYSGVTSPSLTLTSPSSITLDNSIYRVVIYKDEYVCYSTSASATLDFVEPGYTNYGLPLSVTEGASNDIFGFVLSDQPSSTVIINLTVTPTSQFTVSPNSFSFSNSNWNSTQSVTIRAIDDVLLDGTVTGELILQFDPSSDDCFEGLGPINYNVSVIDNETAGYILSPIIGTLIESDTTNAQFTVILSTQPINDVIIDFINSDTTEKTLNVSSIIFSNLTWNVTQTIFLSSVDDFLLDGDQTSSITTKINNSSDTGFIGLANQTISVVTQDNDTGDFSLGTISGNLIEDSLNQVSFTVELTAVPTSNVIIDFSSGDITEVDIGTSSVTFSPGNWNVPIQVFLNSVDDFIFDGNQTSIISASVSSSSDSSFTAATSKTINVITEDNDIPGYTLSPVVGTLTENSAITAEFLIILDAAPSSDVIINLSNGDSSEVIINQNNVTFTSNNWNVSQTIILFSKDDFIIDGSQTSSITASVDTFSDSNFISLETQTVSVVTFDNDSAGVKINILDNLTSESGETGTFEVLLEAIPSNDVIIDLSSSNLLEGTIINSSITFTSLNWNIPQIILVTGVDDTPPLSDGAIDFKILTGNVSSSDLNFNALVDSSIEDVNMINQDNDAPGITVTLLNNDFTTSESGKYVTVQFSLLSKPLGGASVSIPLSLSGTSGEMILSKNSITILDTNWDNPLKNQITVTGIDDLYADGNKQLTLVTGDPTSSDVLHNSLTAENVADPLLTNEDDDIPQIIKNKPNPVSENGTTSVIDVKLGSMILSDVILNLSVLDKTELEINISRLTFKPENWNIDQQVTITGQDDLILDGDISTTIYIYVDPLYSDFSYQSLEKVSLLVINEDNERDDDGDLVKSEDDNCPNISNADQQDLDQDGEGDLCDQDIDGDGVKNEKETIDQTDPYNSCSFFIASITLPETIVKDCDFDGIPNSDDLDDDNDGILDTVELDEDTDGDGLPNHTDLDSDNDGCFDVIEAGYSDPDGDGVLGRYPIVSNSDGTVDWINGYGTPSDYNKNNIFDFKEVSSPIPNLDPNNTIYIISEDIPITLSYPYENLIYDFQWQVNYGDTDWIDLVENNDFENTNTSQLTLASPKISQLGWRFRLKFIDLSFRCGQIYYGNPIVLEYDSLVIPNALSPNNDGLNDFWVIGGVNIKSTIKVSIYNRWEQKVYHSSSYRNDWDGNSNLGLNYQLNNKLPSGVYFYILKEEEKGIIHKGFIYLNR